MKSKMAAPMSGTMSYKPGDVSAALFGKKTKSGDKDKTESTLLKDLFSASKNPLPSPFLSFSGKKNKNASHDQESISKKKKKKKPSPLNEKGQIQEAKQGHKQENLKVKEKKKKPSPVNGKDKIQEAKQGHKQENLKVKEKKKKPSPLNEKGQIQEAKQENLKVKEKKKKPSPVNGKGQIQEAKKGHKQENLTVKEKKKNEIKSNSTTDKNTVSRGKTDDDGTNGFPIMHETLSKSNPPKNEAKKRKREAKKKADDDDETPSKRLRLHRHRDKTNDKRTIFIGNCSLSTDKKTLKNLFGQFGAIESLRFRCAPSAQLELPRRAVVITKNFHEQSNSFVAYIVFKEESDAQKALKMNGHLLNGLHLRVDLASQSKTHDKKRSIFVGNLPFDTKEDKLRSHFEDCGDILNVRIVRDRRTSLGKGIAYVQFDSKDSVNLALKLDGSEFRTRTLRVRVCSNNPNQIEKRKAKKEKKDTKSSRPVPASKEKRIAFAPSNLKASSFQSVLKIKKDKRLRKIKKKKENSKKSDGLSAIFGVSDQKKNQLQDKGKKRKLTKDTKGKRREKGPKGASKKPRSSKK